MGGRILLHPQPSIATVKSLSRSPKRRMTSFRAEPHQDLERVLFSAEQIAARISEVGR